jgi:ubiquinone/menaquinone biosynthesis C-methylase UbiE
MEKYLTGIRKAMPLAAEQIEVMVRLISATQRPVTNFLDLGCGDGILASAILKKYPGARGVLLDFSSPMIEAAREKLKDYASNLDFMILDYADSRWLDSVSKVAPFDVIVSGFSIHHQPDKKKQELYSEIYGLLKPGGVFLNIEHVSSPTRWIESVFEEYFIDSLYDMHLSENSQKSRGQVADEFHNRPDKEANILAPVETQCDWLRRIGFSDVDCYFKVFELAVFGGRRPLE